MPASLILDGGYDDPAAMIARGGYNDPAVLPRCMGTFCSVG